MGPCVFCGGNATAADPFEARADGLFRPENYGIR
jgi:hypothetical protein